MAIEVFNRQELKFVITSEQYDTLLPTILQHMRFDKHNREGKPYRLYNLYIDTNDYALIRHSMIKPTVYKEKLRIRSYEPLTDDSLVFLEVKKRYKKITNKRRTQLPLNDALNFITTGILPVLPKYANQQVINELSTILQQHSYEPKVYITYDRMAFRVADANSDLRITFDTNLISQQFGSDKEFNLLGDNKLVMEVKSTANMPLWLVDLLEQHNIRKQSFSKYGHEYTRILQANNTHKEQHA